MTPVISASRLRWLITFSFICNLLFSANSAISAEPQQWQSVIVKRISEKTKVINAVENLVTDEAIEIDDQQIVAVTSRARRPGFFAVPFVVKGGAEDGCFAQVLSPDFALGPMLKLSDSPQAGACDAVISIFLAKRAKDNKTYLCFILAFRPNGHDNYHGSSAWSFDAMNLEFQNEAEIAGLFRGLATAQDARRKISGKPIRKSKHR